MQGNFFVIGRQRSGTTVFRSILSKTPSSIDMGEIFHSHESVDNNYYFYYRERMIEKDVLCSRPSKEREIFDLYMRDMEIRHEGLRLIIDVKYGDLDHVRRMDAPITDRLYLKDFLEQRSDIFFHLIRKNKLRLLASEKIALKTKAWRSENIDDIAFTSIKLPPGKIERMIDSEWEQTNYVRSMFGHLPNYHEVYYEDMFDEEWMFSRPLIQQLGFVTGCNEFDIVPAMKKQNDSPVSQLVSNYDDVASRLRRSPYRWMLEE
jgi:hypothetical protein